MCYRVLEGAWLQVDGLFENPGVTSGPDTVLYSLSSYFLNISSRWFEFLKCTSSVKVKVKQSLYRPRVAQRVPGS